MATIVIPPTASDPSMSDLRAMISQAAPQEVKLETPEPVAPATTNPEADSEPAEPIQEPTEQEEALPPAVVKRIAKEAEKASRIQSEIDRAVSNRKAKESELAAIAKPGSDPAPITEAKDAKPTKPEFGRDGQTWGQYQEDLRVYEANYESWILAETERKVEAKFAARQTETASKARWDAAVTEHGKDFPALMELAQKTAPAGLQQAISGLDNWSGVAVHLAKNPGRLAEVVSKFGANPYAAIAELGRIEASLKTAPKSAAAALPAPPAAAGGGASASVGAFDVENASMAALAAHIRRIRAPR